MEKWHKQLAFYLLAMLCFNLMCLTAFTQLRADSLADVTEELFFLAQRDSVLSKNIANLDTPGYKAQDITRLRDTGIGVSTTHPNHIMESEAIAFELFEPNNTDMQPNGNNVDGQIEMKKKASNALELQKNTLIYDKLNSMIKAAMVSPKS